MGDPRDAGSFPLTDAGDRIFIASRASRAGQSIATDLFASRALPRRRVWLARLVAAASSGVGTMLLACGGTLPHPARSMLPSPSSAAPQQLQRSGFILSIFLIIVAKPL